MLDITSTLFEFWELIGCRVRACGFLELFAVRKKLFPPFMRD